MQYYLVEKIGDGTRENPIRPNVPDELSYVCTEINNMFLVGTSENVTDKTKISDLHSFCTDNGLNDTDLAKWFAGDN